MVGDNLLDGGSKTCQRLHLAWDNQLGCLTVCCLGKCLQTLNLKYRIIRSSFFEHTQTICIGLLDL